MLPHQNRSLVAALRQEKLRAAGAVNRCTALEREYDLMFATLLCVQSHWEQLERDVRAVASQRGLRLAVPAVPAAGAAAGDGDTTMSDGTHGTLAGRLPASHPRRCSSTR
jgi:hypothetical protein